MYYIILRMNDSTFPPSISKRPSCSFPLFSFPHPEVDLKSPQVSSCVDVYAVGSLPLIMSSRHDDDDEDDEDDGDHHSLFLRSDSAQHL